MTTPQILVKRDAIGAPIIASASDRALNPGEARLTLDLFSLTANNVTYAAMGDSFRYWDFFPAPEGHGLVPVWGFATVAESRVDTLHEGERIWGYYPFAQSLVVTPDRLTERGFIDGAPHRQPLPPVYNAYERVARDPLWSPGDEALIALFRPLFTTSFLIDDAVADQNFFGAERVAFASASSKTALGAAALLKARGSVEVVGLTSARNTAFCEATGYFDRVVAYDDLAALPADKPAALIDMAGDACLIDRLAGHLGAAFVFNLMVGAAHWQSTGRQTQGPPRTLFFAPDRIVQRTKDWGREGYGARYAAAWTGFKAGVGWLKVHEVHGAEALAQVWARLAAGGVGPDEGLIGRF